MPELPEVETVVRELRPLLIGRRITGVSATAMAPRLRLCWDPAWEAAVTGRSFSGVRRRGKWLLLDFAGGGSLLGHLGMSGQLTIVPAATERDAHAHLEFRLSDRTGNLRYRDPRRFGGLRFVESESVIQTYLAERLGPEPWDLDLAAWHLSLKASKRPLKALLLDQTVVAGVGNIYADEALHRAKLAPTQKGSETTRGQVNRLRAAIVAVLERAIKARGTTFDTGYVGGGFQNKLRVYGRTGEPCRACRTEVACIRLAGRSTHYCPKCQIKASGRK